MATFAPIELCGAVRIELCDNPFRAVSVGASRAEGAGARVEQVVDENS